MEFSNPSPEEQPGTGLAPEFPTFAFLLILLVAILFGSMIGSGIVLVIASTQGYDLNALLLALGAESPLQDRNFVRLANLISHFFTFTVPPLLVVYFFYRQSWLRFLRLDRAPEATTAGLSIPFIIAGFPVAQVAYWLNRQLPIPEWAASLETSAEGMLRSLLVMESPAELLFNLLVMAVLPAFGEELLFRGVVQQTLERISRRPHLAIWSSALVFSAIHMQFEGFIPRMLLGAALGYLFYWCRNLWIPILAHLIFNGTQVAAHYFAREQFSQMELDYTGSPPWLAATIGLAVMIWCAGLMKQAKT